MSGSAKPRFSGTRGRREARRVLIRRMPSLRRPLVSGRAFAVSSMKPLATRTAMRILDAGGNAFDAAVAGQAALALVDPAANGFGADAEVLIYDAKSGSVASINGTAPAPRLATIDYFREHYGGRMPTDDGLAVATAPTVVDVWCVMLERWGTMSLAELLAPAIEVAERGFSLTAAVAVTINTTPKLLRYPTSARLYRSRHWREGDIFANPDAGRLLRMLVEAETAAASRGRSAALRAARDRFYTGDIAHALADFSEAEGGLIRYDDLAGYAALVEAPVSTNYRGFEIYKNASANQGPAELLALNILELFDLAALGHNSPESIHLAVESVKLAMADRERFLGDHDVMPIPFEGLLSKQYAAERRSLIAPTRASMDLRPGDPARYMSDGRDYDYPWTTTTAGDAEHDGDTSYLAVVDRERNMVSFEPSLHSDFGTGVVMGDLGIILNCRGDYFRLEPGMANSLQPGKRPRSTLQSTLVLKDGRPFMITGSPGGDDQVLRTLQTLVNVVDFGMNPQGAIEAARFSTYAFPASPFPQTMHPGHLAVESRIGEDVQRDLGARGHRLEVVDPWSLGSNAAIIVRDDGTLEAGADPRVEAEAEAR